MSQAASQSVRRTGKQPKHQSPPNSCSHIIKIVMFFMDSLFLGIFHLFCPIFLPYIFTCFLSVSYPVLQSPFLPLFFFRPSATWVGLQGCNHTRLIAASKRSNGGQSLGYCIKKEVIEVRQLSQIHSQHRVMWMLITLDEEDTSLHPSQTDTQT